MLILILGGAASGKSGYAERIAALAAEKKYYLATMQPFDPECEARIQKHRNARKGRGFETVERYTDIHTLSFPEHSAVLLECLSNLAANEMFSPEGAQRDVCAHILRGIDSLCKQAETVVVVSNELFSDGIAYPEETERYISLLGCLNRKIASRADQVVEVVCGIPLFWKGGGKA